MRNHVVDTSALKPASRALIERIATSLTGGQERENGEESGEGAFFAEEGEKGQEL